MPKFYFHLRSSKCVSIDEHGIDLPDAVVARREALMSAQEITTEMLVVDALSLSDAILEVVDQNGKTIAVVSFLEAAADHAAPSGRYGSSVTGTRH